MIEVSVAPGDLVAGQRSSLSIRFANTGRGPCSHIVFELGLPVEVMLVGGSYRVEIPMIPAGRAHAHEVTVEASRPGRFELTSTYFSYRDEFDAPTRVTDFRSKLAVADVVPPEPQDLPAAQTILFLAASPQDLPPLRSDVDVREVRAELRRSDQRDRYRIEPCPAARFKDISRALIYYKPHVVHFSGHGGRDGNLRIEDEQGNSDSITPEVLAELFGQHRSTIRCVILSACYSERLARTIAAQIDYVIGMHDKISDEAAIQFSGGFYLALFAGTSVPEAFARGRTHIRAGTETEREHLTPLLFSARA